MYDYEYSPATKPAMPQASPAEIERFLHDGSGGGVESCSNKPGPHPIAIAMYTQGFGYAFMGGGTK